jgi:hypothetical protein
MWLDAEQWTPITRADVAADARAFRARLRDWIGKNDGLITSIEDRSETAPRARLADAQLGAMEAIEEFKKEAVLLAVQTVLAEYDTLGEELARLVPGDATDRTRWYRITFDANGGHHTLCLTRALAKDQITALIARRLRRPNTLTCISYQTHEQMRLAGKVNSRRLRVVPEQDWVADAVALKDALDETLRELGATPTPIAAPSTRRRTKKVAAAAASVQQQTPASVQMPQPTSASPGPGTPATTRRVIPEAAFAARAPRSAWDGFASVNLISQAELDLELTTEFLASPADRLREGEHLFDLWHTGADAEVRSVLDGALQTAYVTELMLAYARFADYLLQDDRLADQLYPRAVTSASQWHPAHWFFAHYLLRTGRQTTAYELAQRNPSLVGYLQRLQIQLPTETTSSEEFERAMYDAAVNDVNSLVDGAIVWHRTYRTIRVPLADPLVWQLAQARELEETDKALAERSYLDVLESVAPGRLPVRGQTRQALQRDLEGAMPGGKLDGDAPPIKPEHLHVLAIRALRGLRRVGSDPEVLRDRWRKVASRFGDELEFRKQYLVYLQLKADPGDAGEIDDLRARFEAERSAASSVARAS